MLKFLLSSTNLVTRTIAQIAIVSMVGTVGITVASTAASASLDAIASNIVPQTIQSGTLTLVSVANASSIGFSESLTAMAPGDNVSFAVGVSDTGTIGAQDLWISINDTQTVPTSALTTSLTKGLTFVVNQCTQAWSLVSNAWTCPGATETTTASTAVAISTINTNTNSVAGGAELKLTTAKSISPSTPVYLKFTLALPNISETVTNGVLPGGTIQGLSAGITWKIRTTQRTASTFNG